jgi:hypothetical protein
MRADTMNPRETGMAAAHWSAWETPGMYSMPGA